MKNPWSIKSETKIYDNSWINVTEFKVLTPKGTEGIYGKVHFKNIAVGVVPIDENGDTYLVGQYRFTIDQYSWEMPEGGCLIGKEMPLEAAKRELSEETGLTAAYWDEIMQLHTSNSVTDELAYVFLARGLTMAQSNPDDTESLEIIRLPFEEAFSVVLSGKITDAFTVAAYYKVNYLLEKGLLAYNPK
jgi:8-oxo-dGTP pyrophosphatase MutT (NUDIX family)